MYKGRVAELKSEGKKIRAEIIMHNSALKKLERRLAAIGTEMDYVRALDMHLRTGKPLPELLKPKAAVGGGRKKKVRKGGKRLVLTKLIPEVLASAKNPLTTNELIKALIKMGWKSASAKPYPVVYNSATILIKKGVLVKTKDSKFSLK